MARAGRPKDASKDKPPVTTVEESRCPRPECQSTRRGSYYGTTEQEHRGLDDDGKPYTHIVRRRTKCLDCGQGRIDRTYENRAEAEN